MYSHFWLQLVYDVVGSSYANALVDTAQKNSCLEAVHADVDALASVMKDNQVSGLDDLNSAKSAVTSRRAPFRMAAMTMHGPLDDQ